MLTVSQFVDGTITYIEAEILPVLDGWQVWVAGAALSLARKRADTALEPLLNHKAVRALGLVSDTGLLDLDAAYIALKAAAQKHGSIKVDLGAIGDFSFCDKDLEALYKHLKKIPPAETKKAAEGDE